MVTPQKWEYKRRVNVCDTVSTYTETLQECVEWANADGQEGWELILMTVTPSKSDGVGPDASYMAQATAFAFKQWIISMVFKRPC